MGCTSKIRRYRTRLGILQCGVSDPAIVSRFSVPREPPLGIQIPPTVRDYYPIYTTHHSLDMPIDPIKLKKPPTSRRTSVAVNIVPLVNPPAWNVPVYDEGEVEAELIC